MEVISREQMENKEKRMTVWLIKEGEPLPIEKKVRLMRTASLAKYLAGEGHHVVWWSSSFLHGEKQYISKKHKIVDVQDNEKLVLLHSPVSYRKNVSFSRILYHQRLAREFRIHAQEFKKPDIILCSWPTQQFAEEAVKYGKRYHVPVVIDIRDFWPDYFLRVLPKRWKPLGEILLTPLKFSASRVLKQADALTGNVPAALEWGLRYAGRKRTALDKVIPIGAHRVMLTEDGLAVHVKWWEELGVTKETWNICLIATLSSQGDYDTLIKAVIHLSNKYDNIRLIVGGTGDREGELRAIADNSKSVFFAGWLNKDQMDSLMLISKVGAFCYKNTDGFRDAFGNKVVQYLSAGLPVLNSAVGYAKEILDNNRAGLTYKEGDPMDCARTLEILIENAKTQEEMGRNAKKLFEKEFDMDIVNRNFYGLFSEILDGNGKKTEGKNG